MYTIIQNIIGLTQTGTQTITSLQQQYLYIAGCTFVILMIILLDWTRGLFRSLFNRLK